jgi:hypothetical protein
VDCFLLETGWEDDLTGTDLTSAGVTTALPFPLSNAGKSSDRRLACVDCDAMVVESPVLIA